MKGFVLAVVQLLGSFALNADELDLAGVWTLTGRSAADRPIACPIAVPGGVHSALLEARLIPDVFYGANETQTLWVARHNWTIAREFEVSASFLEAKEVVLRLEDCDTFCTVTVNGQVVGQTTDRFQRYTFEVKRFLKAGRNTIAGTFSSPVRIADARRAAVGRPYPISNPIWAVNQALIRKPACHAGWDWGPELEVIGFGGTVKLLASDHPRIDYVYTTQDFNDALTRCTLTVFADLSDGTTVTNVVEIDNPPLWWPNGAGEQRFYEYEIEVSGQRLKRRIGLRKLEVLNERTVSADGKDELSLVFRVNNRRLFMKGANWIPCDAYENRQTPEKYHDLIESAAAANMNMLRVWGGGQYEKDIFYDLCDELGILLWHDMMCSCAVYPGEGEVADEIRAELKHQLRRLRDHASIALWCGDNECLGAINWFEETKRERGFYRNEWVKRSKLQEEAVAKYDPTRSYWPSSPCCGPGDFGDGWKEDSKGDMHNWTVWHANEPFAKYCDCHPRFCSEFGFQSFPSMEVAETFATREQILMRASEFEWHQKNIGGNERIRKTMVRYFPEPKDVPAEILLSQFQQAMAIQTAVDAWRAEQPRCMGTLFWQLNDNWPVASWSSIEYGGKWKPLQYLAKRFYAPLRVVRSPNGMVTVINDTAKRLTGEVRAVFHGFDGEADDSVVLAPPDTAFPVNAATKVGEVSLREDAVLRLILVADGELAAESFPALETYRGLNLPPAKVSLEVDGFRVTVKTDRPAFWVWIDTPGVRGTFSDNGFTLPGRYPHTVTFTPVDPKTTPEDFRNVLRVTHLAELVK